MGLREIKRVCSLPIERAPTPEEIEAFSRQEVAPEWFDGTAMGAVEPFRLWGQQVQAVFQFMLLGGAFVSLPVGRGKTGVSWLCVKNAHAPRPFGRGIKRTLFLVPSRAFRKLQDQDRPKVRRILGVDVPTHLLSGLSPTKRLKLAKSGLPGVYCSTHSLLQSKQAMEEIRAISPELVVVDEAHVMCSAASTSATKRRFFKLVEELRPMCVWLSGTMSRKTLMDSWPLAVFALREHAPVPVERATAEFWAAVVDAASGTRVSRDLLEAMEPLREWALEQVRNGRIDPAMVGGPLSPDAEGIRRAYRVRLNTAPGVIACADGEVATTLVIANCPAFDEAGIAPGSDEDRQAGWDALVNRVEADLEQRFPRGLPLPEDWVPATDFEALPPIERVIALLWAVGRDRTPSGDEIEHAFHRWGHSYEISAGFYNQLTWPSVPEVVESWRVDEKQAEEALKGARKHHRALQKYHKQVRQFLEAGHVEGLDTPGGVLFGCGRKDKRLPRDLYDAWLGVQAEKFENMPARRSSHRRVSDWKVRAAIRWARDVEAEHGSSVGGLVWAWNNEVLTWAHEVFLAEFGPDRVMFCPRGKAQDRMISDPSNAGRFTLASIGAHGEAKDLFHWSHQVMIQTPRPANVMQQTLGRTHRPGQLADELVVRTLHTTEFDHGNYSAMLHDSMWISQAEDRQKAVFADYDPVPRRYPARFLRERGFKLESMDQDAALRVVFSGGEE